MYLPLKKPPARSHSSSSGYSGPFRKTPAVFQPIERAESVKTALSVAQGGLALARTAQERLSLTSDSEEDLEVLLLTTRARIVLARDQIRYLESRLISDWD